MQFMNHIFAMGYIGKRAKLVRIVFLRMVAMSVKYGICNISPLAFASYGAMFITDENPDVESGHRMGRVATEMTAKLGAVEVCV